MSLILSVFGSDPEIPMYLKRWKAIKSRADEKNKIISAMSKGTLSKAINFLNNCKISVSQYRYALKKYSNAVTKSKQQKSAKL